MTGGAPSDVAVTVNGPVVELARKVAEVAVLSLSESMRVVLIMMHILVEKSLLLCDEPVDRVL